MTNIQTAKALLSNETVANACADIMPDSFVVVQDMVNHYDWYADSPAPSQYMSEGEYMRATDAMKELEWAEKEIAEDLAMLLDYAAHFEKYGPQNV